MIPVRVTGWIAVVSALVVVSGCVCIAASDMDVDGDTTYQFVLKYSANGGSGAPDAQTFSGTAENHVFTVVSDTPSRTGYDFLGWATTADADTATIQAGSHVTVSAGQTVTLYAVWSAQSSHTATASDVQSILAGFFDGDTTIAGIVMFVVILGAVFAIFRTPTAVLVVMIPAALVLSLLGVVPTDILVILIIVAVLGLAMLARDSWRST